MLTGRFFPDVSGATPVSINFSPAGSNMELQSLLVQEYVLPLPKLEWVVWGVCPRFFNEHRRDNDHIDQFTESHGYRYDQEHADELWPIPENTPLQTVAQVNDWGPPDTDAWGATPREDAHSPSPPNDAARKKFLDQFDIVRFDWDATQWDLFVDRLKDLHERNIRVLVFTPPTHPLARDGRASDPDSTGREHEAMVIDRLEALDSQFSNMWFEDIHRAGHHEFTNDDFSDAGHLDQSGADRLTARLARRVHHLDAAGS